MGAMKPPQEATPQVQNMLNDCRAGILAKLGRESGELKALRYTNRAVRGGNYVIETLVDDATVVHVKINIFPQAVLCGVRTDVSRNSPLELFDDN